MIFLLYKSSHNFTGKGREPGRGRISYLPEDR